MTREDRRATLRPVTAPLRARIACLAWLLAAALPCGATGQVTNGVETGSAKAASLPPPPARMAVPAPAAPAAPAPPESQMEEIRFDAPPAPAPAPAPVVPATPPAAAPSEELRVVGDPATRRGLPVPEIDPEPALATIGKVFIDRFGLAVPLGDVVLLVILTNVFALFRSPRMILLMSYLFSLKWVILSNYQEVAHYSLSMAHLTTWILAICGLFTLVLFCLDWFNKH